jgi:hypothetical protein
MKCHSAITTGNSPTMNPSPGFTPVGGSAVLKTSKPSSTQRMMSLRGEVTVRAVMATSGFGDGETLLGCHCLTPPNRTPVIRYYRLQTRKLGALLCITLRKECRNDRSIDLAGMCQWK